MSVLRRSVLLLASGGWALSAGAASLPDQSADRHLGVASCASSMCHGAVVPSQAGALRNEFVTWSHDDAHAKAYEALTGPLGRRIASKLGIEAPESAKACLGCHTDNVPAGQRGAKFSMTDGVGCEACHGGAERWIASHSTSKSYAADVKNGLYPTADLRDRAPLCLSCHAGTADKFATHRMMGAGHPRLSFEMDTFLALEPPHYRVDGNYRQRKPAYTRTQTWARGQLLAAEAQLATLEGPIAQSTRTFPELALFNCTSCHDSVIRRPEWRARTLTQGLGTGVVLLNDATLRMCWVISRVHSIQDGDHVRELILALQHDAVENWHHVPAASAQLRGTLKQLRTQIEARDAPLSPRPLLDAVIQAGIEGEYRDYLGAEQAVMAIDLLLLDDALAPRFKAQRDELFRLLRSDETFRSGEFTAALTRLHDALH